MDEYINKHKQRRADRFVEKKKRDKHKKYSDDEYYEYDRREDSSDVRRNERGQSWKIQKDS